MKKIKVCQRGYEYAQIWTGYGDVRVCCWVWDSSIRFLGSLCKNSIEEIWHGENAKKFRESLKDGSYRFCSKESCPWLANDDMESHLIEIDENYEPEYPLNVNLAYEWDCNYKCTCCRTEHYKKKEDELKRIEKIEKELSKFINRVNVLGANGRGEVFASKNILRILHDWKPDNPKKATVILETNGSLFNEKNWEQISNLGQYNLHVAITIMSLKNDIYQFLTGTNLDVSKLIDNLRFVKQLREKGIINHLELATVVQEKNIYDLPEFTRRCIEEFEADVVRLRPFYPYCIRKPEFEWFADIRNPNHPYYDEYVRIMSNSIFSNPKVLKWAADEVSTIGTMYEYLKKEDPKTKNEIASYVCNIKKEQEKTNELSKKNDELIKKIGYIEKENQKIKESFTYKIGSGILFLPKKVRRMLKML